MLLKDMIEQLQRETNLKEIKSDCKEQELKIILKDKTKENKILSILNEYPVCWQEIKTILLTGESIENIKELCEISLKIGISIDKIFSLKNRRS